MTEQISPGALMSVPEAAEVLGCSQRMVRKLVHTRQIPFVRIGRLIRFRRSDIDGYITANTQPATTGARAEAAGVVI
jgi:excisionase family DNA binding protein